MSVYKGVNEDKIVKNAKIEIRLTQQEKELLREYADERHLTMSEAIRWLCEDIFNPKAKVIEENK